MKRNLLALWCLLSLVTACGGDDSNPVQIPTTQEPETFTPVAATKTNGTKLFMHYMTWFETNESSGNGQWGYHWTMANRNPNIIDADGKRQIASHYYPSIGPYHSGDDDVIEYHLLTMKYAGIDGLLIDWYGTYDVNDYRMIKDNTDRVIAIMDKVGLQYAIVYEDRFLPNIVTAGLAASTTAAARTDLNWLQSNCFSKSNYIKINNQPLLLSFGPITLQTQAQWTDAFTNLSPKPFFLTLWYESADAGTNATGEYAWVYQNNTSLSNFYNTRAGQIPFAMGGAYPGFNDFYALGGGGASLGWTIAHNNGATMDQTLSLAQTANVDYLQLITWNDFGEGTMIEPTLEFGYSYVQKLRNFAGVQAPDVFADIKKLYDLRKQYPSNTTVQAKLDRAFGLFVSMRPTEAQAVLNEI